MTSLLSGLRRAQPIVVDPKRATELLPRVGGKLWMIDGKEYAEVGSVATIDEAGPDERLLKQEVSEGEKLSGLSSFRRLVPAPDGTHAERLRKRAKFTATSTKPADVLSALTALKGVQGTVLPTARGAYAEPRPGARGRSILDHLERQGVTLQVFAGKLLVIDANDNLLNDLRDVIERAEPLLIGWLTDKPATCQLTHPKDKVPEAFTVLVGGLLACEAHASGDLRP